MPRSKSDVLDEDARANAKPFDWGLLRLSDEGIEEFARSLVRGEIFTEMHIAPSHRNASIINMVFMGMSLAIGEMSPEVKGAMEKAPPGMMYAHYRVDGRDNTFPRSINGYPIFNQCAFLSKEDTNRVQDKYEEIVKENPWLLDSSGCSAGSRRR